WSDCSCTICVMGRRHAKKKTWPSSREEEEREPSSTNHPSRARPPLHPARAARPLDCRRVVHVFAGYRTRVLVALALLAGSSSRRRAGIEDAALLGRTHFCRGRVVHVRDVGAT